jgi:hypothetical protein
VTGLSFTKPLLFTSFASVQLEPCSVSFSGFILGLRSWNSNMHVASLYLVHLCLPLLSDFRGLLFLLHM